MTERVTSLDLGVEWDPNAPDAVLLTRDLGGTALALLPVIDDEDQRSVVLLWRGTRYCSLGGPNDEAVHGHRLYGKGLEAVPWIGEVSDSALIASLERQNSVHERHDPTRYSGLSHHVVLTKEATVEVIADSVAVRRIAGSTIDAAVQALQAPH